jgi:hypothetical protein
MTHFFKTMSAMVAVATVSIASPAMAAERSFYVNNTHSSASVQRVWYAPAGKTDPWVEVFLDYPIKPNSKSSFTMGNGDRCLYDIKIKFDDGYEQEFTNVNVCRGDGVRAT